MPVLHLCVICQNPPATSGQLTFGLQDKQAHLHSGQPLADGSLSFECEADVTWKDSTPNLNGAYIHGTPAARFLYLSLGTPQGDGWQWSKRIKVSLSSLTAEQIQTAQDSQQVLQTTVDGRGAATVPLIGGWQLV